MVDRQFVWSNARVQKLAAKFIPAADASDRLQSPNCQDADAKLFQKFGGRRTIPSLRAGEGLGQGQYAVAPSGELLASCATADPEEVAEMMETALKKWAELPSSKRLLAEDPSLDAANRWRRWERLYPEDGLVLHVVSRDLPRDNVPALWRNAWNQDYAWFRRDEARAFLPDECKPGVVHDVPRDLVERLVRFHLVDNVRALNYLCFEKEAIQRAKLTTTVVEVDAHRVKVRFEGDSLASNPAPDEYGYEPTLRGRATYNRDRDEFEAFELVAVGMRWGAGSCNLRHDDTGPAPMGIVLRLAGKSAAERLPPAFISHYGW